MNKSVTFRLFRFPQVVQKQPLGEVELEQTVFRLFQLCQEYGYQKLLLSGNPSSYNRLCWGHFLGHSIVVVVVVVIVVVVVVDPCSLQLQIWDTAGQERFRRSMIQHYYRNVNAIVYVYDITRTTSFDNLPLWLAECEEHGLDMSVPRILVGNKCDIQTGALSCVSTSTAQRFADGYGMPLFETSAKDNAQCDHVESIFLTLAHKLKNSKSLVIQSSTDESPSVMLSRPPYSPATTDYCLC